AVALPRAVAAVHDPSAPPRRRAPRNEREGLEGSPPGAVRQGRRVSEARGDPPARACPARWGTDGRGALPLPRDRCPRLMAPIWAVALPRAVAAVHDPSAPPRRRAPRNEREGLEGSPPGAVRQGRRVSEARGDPPARACPARWGTDGRGALPLPRDRCPRLMA